MKQGQTGVNAKIFLVDDHPIVRRGFQLLLGLEPDLTVCGEADNGRAALQQIQKLQPDLAVVDLALKDSSGFDLIKQLRALCPKVKILVFTMHEEPLYAERVLRSGAHGYITKEQGTEKAIEAIRHLLQGRPYFTGRIADRLFESMTGIGNSGKSGSIDSLSDRQLDVLSLLGRGFGSADIAKQLGVSIKTVESHREHIKAKLGLHRASELVRYAYDWVNSQDKAAI
jgi:DNA-binding NarL/FixJ family response regulator